MTYGFARDDSTIQAQCPCCGRFTSDDGFYAFIATEPDFVSLFCDEPCVRRYEIKGGKLVDGDGQPYSILNAQ